MSTSVTLRYVIGKTENIFLVGIVPLHGNFDADAILFTNEIEHRCMQRCFLPIQMLDKGPNATLILEHILFVVALVSDLDTYRITSYNVCYTKLLRINSIILAIIAML